MDSANDEKFKTHEKTITTIIISAAFGAIVFLIISLSWDKPGGNDPANYGGMMKLIFSSAIAGLVAGFGAGKNIIMSIKAAVTGAIIGSTLLLISLSDDGFYGTGLYGQPVWFCILYAATLIFVILIVIPAIRGEGWARKTAIIGSILLLAIFSIYFYNRPRYFYYSYPTWFDIIYGLTVFFIIFMIIPAIIGGTVGGWVRKHRPY